MGKHKKGTKNIPKAETPEPLPAKSIMKIKAPRSLPPPPRKKLEQEIDEELSEEDFDEGLSKQMKQVKKHSIESKKLRSGKENGDNDSEEEEEDDDDDDDEMEDEDDIDEDEDDDEDEEGSDEEDGDDGEDSQEEDDEKTIAKKKKDGIDKRKENLSAPKQTMTPIAKGELASKAKALDSTKASTKAVMASGKSTTASGNTATESKDERTLFVKNLPCSTTEQDLKSLSADIVGVRYRKSLKQTSGENSAMAYLEFKDVSTAAKNLTSLNEKKMGNVKIVVEFVREKVKEETKSGGSSGISSRPEPEDFDPLKLYISGYNRDKVSVEDLKKLFSKAKSIEMPMRKMRNKPMGFAFVEYEDAASCRAAHDRMQNKVLGERVLCVRFAKKRTVSVVPSSASATIAGTKRSPAIAKEPQKKKAKLAVQQKQSLAEEDDSDDVDEDNDDDDDDDSD